MVSAAATFALGTLRAWFTALMKIRENALSVVQFSCGFFFGLLAGMLVVAGTKLGVAGIVGVLVTAAIVVPIALLNAFVVGWLIIKFKSEPNEQAEIWEEIKQARRGEFEW